MALQKLFIFSCKVIKTIIFYFAHIFAFVFPYRYATKLIRSIRISFYTGYVSREFKKFGHGSIIYPTFSLLKNPQYIQIGSKCVIGKNTQLTAWDKYDNQFFSPKIIIGDGCRIGEDNHITAISGIVIGNNVLTGKKVLITDNSHGDFEFKLLNIAPIKRPLTSKGTVIIDNNVWIGEKASILPGVHIGEGSIIAANAVITKDIPPYCIAAGVPARVVKVLNKDN